MSISIPIKDIYCSIPEFQGVSLFFPSFSLSESLYTIFGLVFVFIPAYQACRLHYSEDQLVFGGFGWCVLYHCWSFF
jgi:hypothetical protein